MDSTEEYPKNTYTTKEATKSKLLELINAIPENELLSIVNQPGPKYGELRYRVGVYVTDNQRTGPIQPMIAEYIERLFTRYVLPISFGTANNCTSLELYKSRCSDIRYYNGKPTSNITIGTPIMGYNLYYVDHYDMPVNHNGHILRQWERFLSPKRIAPVNNRAEGLFSANDFELRLLCQLYLDPRLYNILSKTYHAMLLALIVGHVITPQQDVTLTAPWKVWSKFSIVHVDDASRYYVLSLQEFGINDITDYTTCYNILGKDAGSRPIYNLLETGWNHWSKVPFGNRSLADADGNIIRARLRPETFEVAKNIGLDVQLYTQRDNPMKVLTDNICELIPYHLYMAYGLNRPPLLPQPTRKEEPFIPAYFTDLYFYSDFEIKNYYLPHLANDTKKFDLMGFTRRYILIFDIGNSYHDFNLTIKLGVGACDNDDNTHIIAAERRGDVRHEYETQDQDVIDKFVKYGPRLLGSRRRCFQVSELLGSFRDTEYGFQFGDPDWHAPVDGVPVMDPLTGRELERNFKLGKVKKFRKAVDRYLINHDDEDNGNLEQLRDLINNGFDKLASNNDFITGLRDVITIHPQWRNDLLIYFSWLFLFAMWIRFWKGPGNPYPAVWQDRHEDVCEYIQRDQHIGIELSVHGLLLTTLEVRNPDLANFIKDLPYVHYDWRTSGVTQPLAEVAEELVGASTVEGVIDKVQLNDFCMAQASDLLAGSAFTYLTHVLDVPLDKLNGLLVYVMLLLNKYELEAITSRESSVQPLTDKDREVAMGVIQQHRLVLNAINVNFQQPPLDVSKITFTGHLPNELGEILMERGD